MTQTEIWRLENELLAARKLTGFQLEKLQRQKRIILSLEKRIARLDTKIELLEVDLLAFGCVCVVKQSGWKCHGDGTDETCGAIKSDV